MAHQLLCGPGRGAKILPPFVVNAEDLDTEVQITLPDATKVNVTKRKLWKRVAIKNYQNDPGDKVNYDITDNMILAYSKQYEALESDIQKHVNTMRTWNQLAEIEGQNRSPRNGGDGKPPTNASYFGVTWLVKPIRHGPLPGACGCGCGCGCGSASASDWGVYDPRGGDG